MTADTRFGVRRVLDNAIDRPERRLWTVLGAAGGLLALGWLLGKG